MRLPVPGGTFNSFLAASLASRTRRASQSRPFEVTLEDGSVLTGDVDWDVEEPLANVLLVHGLASSCRDPAVCRQSAHLAQAGFRVYRLNHRNVGTGRGKAKGIYHAGRGSDLVDALEDLTREVGNSKHWMVVGQSLTGNMVLKIAGQSQFVSRLHQTGVLGCVAVSPIIDLEGSSRLMGQPAFGLLEKIILGTLRRYLDKVPDLPLEVRQAGQAARSLMEIDEKVVSRYLGLKDRFEYYRSTSCAQELTQLEIPCRVIASRDDPIAADTFTHLQSGSSDYLNVDLTKYGGHLGFISFCFAKRRFVAEGDEKVVLACMELLNGIDRA